MRGTDLPWVAAACGENDEDPGDEHVSRWASGARTRPPSHRYPHDALLFESTAQLVDVAVPFLLAVIAHATSPATPLGIAAVVTAVLALRLLPVARSGRL